MTAAGVVAIVIVWCITAVTVAAGWAFVATAAKRRTGGPHAPGAGQNPVPGNAPPCGAASPPSRPSPAPGHDDHGGKVKIVELWADGRLRTFDPRTGNVVIRPGFCPACAEGGDWDAALRDLRRGTS